MMDYAILIGIGTYPDTAQLDPLKGPHNDLNRIEKWLIKPKAEGGGGLDENNILCLTEEGTQGQNASYGDIENAVTTVIASLSSHNSGGQIRPWGGRLYLYFAGHGMFPPPIDPFARLEAGFLPEDWRPALAGKYIPVFQLALFLMQARYFEEIVVVSDACRSAMMQKISPQSLNFTHDPDPTGNESKLLLCYAARHNEFAVEREFDGKFMGVFSKALSEALVAAPRNANGQLTYLELKNFIESRMSNLRRPHDYQHPRFEVLAMGEQISLAEGPLPELEIRIKFSNGGYGDDIVLLDQEFNELARIPAGATAPVSISKTAGEYYLEGPPEVEREILNYELEGVDIVL